jgi:hypothetical protein
MSIEHGIANERHLARAARLANVLLLAIAAEITASISLFALQTRRRALRIITKTRQGSSQPPQKKPAKASAELET